MSSNAFARSRPRVRQQRVPRTHSCDHPRFLQLVNELARINEAKKKQEEAEGAASGIVACSSSSSEQSQSVNVVAATITSVNRCNTNNNDCEDGISIVGSSGLCSSAAGSSCCSTTSGAQYSNGYRSLDSNQSTSAPHDNYQQQQPPPHRLIQHHHHHQHHQNHHPHQHSNHHHHQAAQQQHLHQEPQNLGNNSLQHLHQDDRCANKSSAANNFGYSKQNLVNCEQTSSSDFSNNNNPDLRQDENRSKRKRSGNESLGNSRKNPSSFSGGTSSGTSKRHKSSPDAIRPLSPSFTKCPICLLDSMDRDPSFTNTCFHLFCYVCIENWTKNKATCPLCRTKFTKIIYNIKSATNYEEKIASPIRRDDEDNMADRIMLDHLTSLNPNSTVAGRNANSDEVQFIFENLRSPSDVLLPQYIMNPNQMDHRQGDGLHSFNTVTASTNFNSNVPPQFQPTSYPISSNYILTFQSNRMAPTSTAITGAYTTANTSLTNINTDPSSRRLSRGGRFNYNRSNHEAPVDAPTRVSRTSSSISAHPQGSSVPLEHRHHPHQLHQQHQHQNQHQHYHQQHGAHRSTLDMSSRQNQRMEQAHNLPLPPYQFPPRYNPNVYSRRPYNTHQPQIDHQQILDSLYRHSLPEM